MLAKFPAGAPNGQADPLAEKIVYFGETCASLKARWRQFQRSAFEDGSDHSGGETYRRLFPNQVQDLYVAARPVRTPDSPIRRVFIRYIERKLLWEYTQRWQRPPVCNNE